jgi:hypothetical protein
MSTQTAPRRSVTRWRWTLAALVAAWLVPVATHVAGVDWLLVPVFLVALAGLQRGLVTALDRLVVGLAQAFGALGVAGLVFSYVGRLHPVVLAGTAFTLLVAASTRRGWVLPRRTRVTDALVGVCVLGVAVLAVVPFALRDIGARLGIVAVGEDFSRHFVLFDQIGALGGYAFLHPAGAATLLPAGEGGMRAYPQGTHYAYAVLDRFLRSSSRSSADPIVAMDVMIWLYVATFVFLALAVLWSAARIAGPGARPAAALPVLALAAAWLYFGEPMAIFLRGFPNELVGLALAALLTAVVVRPLTDRADQLATVALLLAGISFSYHLFLPYAGVLALGWAVRHRMWRHRAALVLAAPTLAVVALTPLLNLHAASARQLTIAGTALAADVPAFVALLALATAGLVVRGGLRSPARRMGTFALGAAVAILLALGVFQLVTVGHTVYYFGKLLHLTVAVGLTLLGGLVRLVPTRGSTARAAAAAATAAAVAALAVAGGAGHRLVPSYGVRLATGTEQGSPNGGRDAVFLARRYPTGGGAVDVDLMDTPYRNFFGTLFASVLQRNYRYGHDWYDFLNPAGTPKTLADLERQVAASPVPVRFHVDNPAASMLVLDPAAPNRASTRPGADPASYGDPGAMTNIEAVRYLAQRYPGRVEVVVERPADR